jgi:hypothetical protein
VHVRSSGVQPRPPADPGTPPSSTARAGYAVIAVAVVAVLAVSVWSLLHSGLLGRTPEPSASATVAGPAISSYAEKAKRLTWEPPELTSPETILITQKNRRLELLPDRDYRIVLPDTPITLDGGLEIRGGRNIVLFGGEIVVPPESEAPKDSERTGLLLKDQFGTAYVEGVKISGQDLAEGINLDQRYGATVILQNIEVGLVHGSYEGHHADILQTWAGPRTLLVDGLRGTTQYQGLFLLPQQFIDDEPERFDLRRILIVGDTSGPEGQAAYLLWTDAPATWLSTQDIVLVDPRDDLEGMIKPYGPWEDGVRLSKTTDDAVLPAGTPGVGYVSPGYQGEAP